MTNRRALKPTLIVTASLLTLGLSCIMPGQYRIYRVANSTTISSPGCFPDGIPEDQAQDTDTFRTGTTFGIFAADTKVYFLEGMFMGGFTTIEGDREGRDYSFSGTQVDVTPGSDNTITDTTAVLVDMTIKGKKVSGTVLVDIRSTCMGNNCPNGVLCTQTTDFEGSEIKGVELEHPV
jgi:hypothetical protein